MTRTRRLGRLAAPLVAVLLAQSPLVASPDTQRGFGTRSGSLAGSNGADVDDASAVFANPAGLVDAPGTQVALGYESHSNTLTHDGTEAALDTIGTYEFGLAVPGAIRGIPIAFGLSLALPDGRLSNLRQVAPTEPYFPLDDAVPRLLDLGTAIAVRPIQSLSLGAGIGFVSSLSGAFRVRGTAVAADGAGAEYDSNLVHAVDADLLSSRYPILGIGYRPFHLLELALSYRGAVRVRQQIEGTLKGDLAIGPLILPVEYAFSTDATVAYSPPELTLFATARPMTRLRVHGAFAWQRYSSFASPYTRTTTRLLTNLPPGLGLPPDEPGTPPPPAGFHDRFVPRLGVERSFEVNAGTAITARGGYAYEHSPVPASQEGTLFFDMNRHALGLGVGLTRRGLNAPFSELRLDLGLEYVLGTPRSFESRGPRGATQHRAEGNLLSLGATLGVFFRDPQDARAGRANLARRW